MPEFHLDSADAADDPALQISHPSLLPILYNIFQGLVAIRGPV